MADDANRVFHFDVPIQDTFGVAALTAELEQDEGRMLRLYFDSRGIGSIGIGRNLVSRGISPTECNFLLYNDLMNASVALDTYAAWWRKLKPNEQRVMLNLCFNLGWYGLAEFRRFLGYMQQLPAMPEGDGRTACLANAGEELRASAWWREVGERGPRMIARLTTA